MVLQAAFDAFAQHALSFPTLLFNIALHATILRSLSHEIPLGTIEAGGNPEVVPGVKLAIYAGLLRGNVSASKTAGHSRTRKLF